MTRRCFALSGIRMLVLFLLLPWTTASLRHSSFWLVWPKARYPEIAINRAIVWRNEQWMKLL